MLIRDNLFSLLKRPVFLVHVFLFTISVSIIPQDLPSYVSKKGGIGFRTDDNQAISRYLEYASIFNRYNQKFNFALNLGRPEMTSDYLNSVRQMQASGHEMLDHTPWHTTSYFFTNLSTDYYINHPGVQRISGSKIELKFANVNISNAKRSGYVNINGDIVTSSSGIFGSFAKTDCYLYFPALGFLAFIDESFGWIDANTVKITDVWRNAVNLGTQQNIQFYNFDIYNVHLTVDGFRALAEESVRLANYYNLQRPFTWIQPGGYFPYAYSSELKQAMGDGVQYKSAGVMSDASLKVFNEYNPNNSKQFGMNYGDFRDDNWSLEQCKEFIANRIAKHHVVFGENHFTYSVGGLYGGWSGFLDRTEKLIQWCIANNIPIKTYSEWADILYNQIPDPNENIMPPLNIDFDANNRPDGYDQISNLNKTDGALSASDYSYTISSVGQICSISQLGGVEKGENNFEIWTKGVAGNFVEVTFKVGSQNLVYKFPAENSNWTKYNLSQSTNGNTSLNIPNNISLIDITIRCSNYSSGEVRISGMKLNKSSGVSDYLNVTPSNQFVSSSSGSTNFYVSSNVSWTVSDDASWLTVTPTSGSGNSTLTASFTNNTSSSQRTGIISVVGNGMTRIVTVTQEGVSPFLSVTPNDRSVSSSSGNTTFSVTSNTNWTVSDDASWLTVTPSSGSNDGTISVAFIQNTNSFSRIGTITVNGSAITRTVTVTQSAAPPSLSITPTNRSVSHFAGSTNFTISSNVNWTVNDDADWINISPTNGSNDGSLIANYSANLYTFSRVGTITINGGGINRIVTITQDAVPYNLTVTPTERNVSYTEGSTTFSISSNTSWTVEDDVDWLVVSPTSSSNDGTITVSYGTNPYTYWRAAVISITGGGINRVVYVNQEAAPFLELTPADQFVGHGEGSITFTVSSNRDWTVEDDADWLTVTPANGSSDGTITVSHSANSDTIQRMGTITVSAGGITKTANVTQESAPFLEVTPLDQYVNHGEGSITIEVSSNWDWIVEDNSDWLTVQPTSGTNHGTLTVTHSANTDTIERIGTITVSGGGITKTNTITQESKPFLDVTLAEQYVSHKEGSTTFTVASNRDWIVEDNSDWLTVQPTSGTNYGTLTINYLANVDTVQRAGIITASGGEITKTVTVTQESAPFLDVTPDDQHVSYEEGSTTFTVTSNRDWTVDDNSDWLTVQPTSGANHGTLTIDYTVNADTIQRVGPITVTSGGITKTVILTQESAPFLEVIPSERFVSNRQGTITFTVNSNRSWTASEEVNWITILSEADPNNSILTVNYAENLSTIPRVGIITVKIAEIKRTVKITQAPGDFLTVAPSSIEVSADSGFTKLKIESNISWNLNEDLGWIQPSKISGLGSDSVILKYQSNPTVHPRTGAITINGGNIFKEVVVTQKAGYTRLIALPNSSFVSADSGRITINIESNTSWHIQNATNWIDISPDSGTGNGSFSITYKSNDDSLVRITDLTISADTVSIKYHLEQKGLDVYQITAMVDSTGKGATSGSGRYLAGSQATVTAHANLGWKFSRWNENQSVVSTDSVFSFTVSSSRTLTAEFDKILTGINDDAKFADNFELFQNYPNPFNPLTKIRYSIPSNLTLQSAKVILKIVDILGNEIATLINEEQNPGFHEMIWNAANFHSGIYIYQIKVADFISTKKMILLK